MKKNNGAKPQYVVTANTYQCGYGAEITLFGVYDDEKIAQDRKYNAEKQYGNASITTIRINCDCEEYLGGYIE